MKTEITVVKLAQRSGLMSVQYRLEPRKTYDEIIASLPSSITIKQQREDDVVLLQDACGNTLWMYKALAQDVGLGGVHILQANEVFFERFGLQGALVHFGESFEEQGLLLRDEYEAAWDVESSYLECRKCDKKHAQRPEDSDKAYSKEHLDKIRDELHGRRTP